MNKSVKRVSCIAMSLLLTAPFIAGCKKDKGADMETRAMVLSIDALDGKFNPYFGAEVLDGNKVLFNTWDAAGAAEATEADRLYDCALTAGTSQTDLVVSYVTPTVVEMDLTIDKLHR